ncbi:Calcium-dependent secretion activator 2 [Liparis tanakae]|uniref:Calcium-dependent secretion activator 2 n=1 Tax=Liparis tanakae TaxID=230148 RepID=A0A4Z2FKG2_9TELE|nr:Calcium-dependent secretion activator 2 [Liparis tanakae]
MMLIPDGMGTVTVEEKENFEDIRGRLMSLLENQITHFRCGARVRAAEKTSLHLRAAIQPPPPPRERFVRRCESGRPETLSNTRLNGPAPLSVPEPGSLDPSRLRGASIWPRGGGGVRAECVWGAISGSHYDSPQQEANAVGIKADWFSTFRLRLKGVGSGGLEVTQHRAAISPQVKSDGAASTASPLADRTGP